MEDEFYNPDGTFNHKRAEAQVSLWWDEYWDVDAKRTRNSKEYWQEYKDGYSYVDYLEWILFQMISGTQLCIQSREEEQEILGDENGEYEGHEARIRVLDSNLSQTRLELESLQRTAKGLVGGGDSFDSGNPSQNAAQGPFQLPPTPDVPFPGGHYPPQQGQMYPPNAGNPMSFVPQQGLQGYEQEDDGGGARHGLWR